MKLVDENGDLLDAKYATINNQTGLTVLADGSFSTTSSTRLQLDLWKDARNQLADGWSVSFTSQINGAIPTRGNYPWLFGVGESQSKSVFVNMDTDRGQLMGIRSAGITLSESGRGGIAMDNNPHDYIFSYDPNGFLLKLFQDGIEIQSISITGTDPTTELWKHLTFGGDFSGLSKWVNGNTYSNLAFYSGAYSPPSVPEPATTGLACLGFATIFMRRRRA